MYVPLYSEIALIMDKHKPFSCAECEVKFTKLNNLRRHVRDYHADKPDYFSSLSKRKNKNYEFSCNECSKNFSHLSNLKFHVKSCHSSERQNKEPVKCRKCALCDYRSNKENTLRHFKAVHNITIEAKTLHFDTVEEFNDWKNNLENTTNSKFVKEHSKACKSFMVASYICHRSGTYIPSGKGLRSLKLQGSNKINAYCPACIKLKKMNDGKCEVYFTETHVGHKNELCHLTLTPAERDNLAQKIALKVPFKDILDNVHNSVSNSTLKRLHFLTRKDLHNIRSYNLSPEVNLSTIESYIKNVQSSGDCFLFYKPQGCTAEEYPPLKLEDFVLIIMTEFQCEMLKKYSGDCVCVDHIYCLDDSNFELNVLLVINDLQETFPCAFLISNRVDKEILNVFFSFVKDQVEFKICPKVFMSDIQNFYFDAWLETMDVPKLRLYCKWHIIHDWRENLTKIEEREKQIMVFEKLKFILQERNIKIFESVIDKFYNKLNKDPATADFAKYFKNNYMENPMHWAYCYILHSSIKSDDSIYFEELHKILKYIYLKHSRENRLDKAIAAIVYAVKDKCIGFTKLKRIYLCHKNSNDLNIGLLEQSENGWTIPSDDMVESYLIQEVKEYDCGCHLVCLDCNICVHKFQCSCIDSSVKNNMCKHIHLLCRYFKENIVTNDISLWDETDEIDKNTSEAYLMSRFQDDNVEEATDETNLEKTHLDETSISVNETFIEEKEKVKILLQQMVDSVTSVTSPTMLTEIKNKLTPIATMLQCNVEN